jgi:hypothetical protein
VHYVGLNIVALIIDNAQYEQYEFQLKFYLFIYGYLVTLLMSQRCGSE